jgi:hypothetical protein
MNDNNTTTTDKLKTLIEAFMKLNPHCTLDLACHAIERVRQFLQLRDADALMARLELLAAESRTASLVGLHSAQLLDAYYQCAIVGLMPMAREGLRTILDYAEHVEIVPKPTGH